MSLYRHALPQLADRPFITDGGLETTLVYHEGIDLPHFAAFVLFDRPERAAILAQYFARYAEIGRANNVGVVLESATWRANPDWGHKLGYNDTRSPTSSGSRSSNCSRSANATRHRARRSSSAGISARAAMVIDPTHG